MSYTPTFEELYTKDIRKHVEKLKKHTKTNALGKRNHSNFLTYLGHTGGEK